MSKCVFYRRSRCEAKARCAWKILELDGRVSCQRKGDLGEFEKTSERFKPVE